MERVSSRVISDEDDDGGNGRKKLRLTKAQSALLEESFKQHSTLNPKQKQDLARELSLRPRQVEVWFQNRRARTKLKQTEVDCEFLKKCCETLTDENRRLQKEVQELKALKLAQPFYMQLPAATLTMCPSCERIGGAAVETSNKSPFTMAPKPHFFNPFTNPSAAC
nr:homeobox-leucine zipper protein HAT22-like [Ipomoea batatas]